MTTPTPSAISTGMATPWGMNSPPSARDAVRLGLAPRDAGRQRIGVGDRDGAEHRAAGEHRR